MISNIRLAVHQPENRAAIAADPGATSPVQGYAGHYCNVPQRKDPGIVACSMIVSGLRVFDIRDPYKPQRDRVLRRAQQGEPDRRGALATTRCRARPSRPSASEVWYTDGNSGFYNVQPRQLAVRGGRPARRPATARANAGFKLGHRQADRARASGSPSPAPQPAREGRGLPGLPGPPRGHQRAPRRALHQAAHVQGRGAPTATTSPASRWPDVDAHAGGSCCAATTAAGTTSPATTAAGAARRCAPTSSSAPCSAAARTRRCAIAYRVTKPARVAITVTKRDGRIVARRTTNAQPGRTYRLKIKAKRRGVYRVRLAPRAA